MVNFVKTKTLDIMLYRFEKDWVNTHYCVVEADSLEEAKEKAENADWEEGEYDCMRYYGYKPWLDEGEECPTLEEYENGEADIEWDDELEDEDFFNHWNN